MLSTENPPPDPLCPDAISQLKNSSCNICSDERASDNNHHQLEVDLCKSGLDDNNQLPKFSIRDYVFSSRSKDIENHWPFSLKNLQLCLKHGVKDVLPPFDSVRNPSTVRSAAGNISNSDVKLSQFNDGLLSGYCNNVCQKPALDIKNVQSCGSEEDKENPSTSNSQSNSDVNSVPVIQSPCAEAEAENLAQSSAEKPEISVLPASNKVESNSQSLFKKCSLVVKLSNVVEPKPNEKFSANASVVSETMASKVCPVCKTFSSSSNTTLNAHIDQCLAGESTIKCTTNSKVIKHRLKPRKTRLIVDIYATALQCTLEDLDRWNGTTWATNSGVPVQDMEVCAEENNGKSVANSEDNKDEGAVYFDSNGTKLRILSKFSDLQSNSNVNDDCGPRKLVKTGKGSKLLSVKKKKHLVHRHKLLECPREGSYSPGPNHCPEVNNGQRRKLAPEEDLKEELSKTLNAHDQMRSNDFGMIKKWVGSKRTGLKKKINLRRENQRPDKIAKDLQAKSNLPSQGDKFIKRNSDRSFPILSDDNQFLPTESYKRKENLSFNSIDEYMKHPCLRKRKGFSLMESGNCYHGEKNHLMLSKCDVKQSKNDGPSIQKHRASSPNDTENHASSRSKRDGHSVQNHHTSLPNDTENYAYSQSNKKMRSTSSDVVGNGSFISSRMSKLNRVSSENKKFGSRKKTALDHAILSGGKKLPSLRKNLLSVKHTSTSQSKKLRKKNLDFKKPRRCHMSRSDEETVSMSANTSKEGDKVLKGTDTTPECDSHGMETVGSSVGGNVPVGTSNVMDVVKEVEIQGEFVCEPTSELSGGEGFMTFGKSLKSGFPAFAGPDVEMGSQHYVKTSAERSPADVELVGEQQNFCVDKVGKGLSTSDTDLVAEINGSEARGNYFLDVDPIPIPGPPGSFLPSPGRMGSEELQGNSSLTTCRIVSSEDDHELIEMDSSDSPVSATSFASDSIDAKSDSVSLVNLSVQSHGVQHESQHDVFDDRMDPLVESSIPSEQAGGADGKPKPDESRANLILPEMSPRRFKNSQPCRCSRKEGVVRNGYLNTHESEHLRRAQAMTFLPPLPSQEKQMGCDPNNKQYCFDSRSETLPEKEPTPEAEKVVANSPKGYATVLVSQNSEAKFPTYGDCESPSTSPYNSVLRLMGKDLMVVSKEENPSSQPRPTQSSTVDVNPSLQSSAFPRGDIQNEHHPFLRPLSQVPSIFGDSQTCMAAQCLDFSSSDGSRVLANFRTPELSPLPSRAVLSSKRFGESLTSSLKLHDYADRFNFVPGQLGSEFRLETPIRYDVEKVGTPIPQLRAKASSSAVQHQEIIVIDDSPDNDGGLATKATDDEVNMEAGASSVRFSASRALGYDSRHNNPFYNNYQMRYFPLGSGSRMVRNANTQVPPSRERKENLVEWNHIAGGGPNPPHPASVTTPFPSTGHRRSSLYFSPGFSLPKYFTS